MRFRALACLFTLFASATLAAPIQAPVGGINPGNLYSAHDSTGEQADDSGIAASKVSILALADVADSDYSIISADRVVELSADLTAPRTWTLPCAESVAAGQSIQILDPARHLSTHFLKIVPAPDDPGCAAGTNTLNGGANVAQLTSPGSRAVAISDGNLNWSVTVVRQPERTLDFAGDFGGIPATAIGTSDCTVSFNEDIQKWEVVCPNTILTEADKGDLFEAQAIGSVATTFLSTIAGLDESDPLHHTFFIDTTSTSPARGNFQIRVVDAFTVVTPGAGYEFGSTQTLHGGGADDVKATGTPKLMTVVAVIVHDGGSGPNHAGVVLTLNPDPTLAGHVNALLGAQAIFTGTISGGTLTSIAVANGSLYRDLKYYTYDGGSGGWYRQIPVSGAGLSGATVDIKFGVVSEAIWNTPNAYTSSQLPCNSDVPPAMDDDAFPEAVTGLTVTCSAHVPLVSFGKDNQAAIAAVNDYESEQNAAHAPACVKFSGRFLATPVDAGHHITGGPCLIGDAQILSGIFIFPGTPGDIFPILNANGGGSVGPIQMRVVDPHAADDDDKSVQAGTFISILTFWGDWSSSVIQNAIKFYGFTQWATVENVSSWNVRGCLICVGTYDDPDKGQLGLIAESTFFNVRTEFTGFDGTSDTSDAVPAFGLDGIGNDSHDTNSPNNDLILRYRAFRDNGLPLAIRPCVHSGVSNAAHQLTISELKVEESNMEQSVNATDSVQVGATGGECGNTHWTQLKKVSGVWTYSDYQGGITQESGVRGIAFVAPSISNPAVGTAAFHFKGCITGDLESMRILGGAITGTPGQNGLGIEFDVSGDGNVVDLVKNSTTDYNLIYSGSFLDTDCESSGNVLSRALEYDAHDQATTAFIGDGTGNIDVMTVLRCVLGSLLTCDNGTLVNTNATQTLTNKTLTAPILTSASLSSPTLSAPTISMSNLLMSPAAPVISSGFGTSPSISASNGTAAFQITVGPGGAATGSVSLSAAANGWACSAADVTTQSSVVFLTKQTASTTNSVTFKNYSNLGANTSWVAGDVLNISCHAF